jgi:prepilin-type N-terminal cleavage/methylation domain-containing protein/prepilin-type processing-associated H-X9-DG protein
MCKHSSPRRGFTLVELLVVIGIIAVLIAILLPSLSKARRQSEIVKCASSLRQIGMAFQNYSNENKGYFPVAVFKLATPPPNPNMPQEMRWQDMLSKYLTKNVANGADDITKFRLNSVLWGCPAWTKAYQDYDESNFADRVRNGYGMQYYPLAPAPATVGGLPPAPPGNLAYIDYASPSVGQFVKQSKWGYHGAERGIVADSITHIIGTAATWSRSTSTFQPFVVTGNIYIDLKRHLAPTASVKECRSSRGANMLFCDGHVSPVNPTEAWVATRGGTRDTSTP